jgi:myo-inositol-hexaphosphate 3-phosphohydrolase
MSATRSQTIPASSRRTIGAALGLVLVVAAAPFLRSASAAQPTGDATATAETAPTSATAVQTADPAIWVNPTDPTKSLILGANHEDGLAVYDMTGAKQAQTGVAAAPMTGVDTRNNVTVAGSPASVAISVGAPAANSPSAAHIYVIDPATGKLADKTAAGAATPAWHVGQISMVCMYQSPVSHNTYAFMLANNGHMVQYQLVDDAVAGKVNLQVVRGYGSTATPATDWDMTGGTGAQPGGCVADDELQTVYVSEKGNGIWKFGAEPGDPTTGTLIDTMTTGTPAGHLTDNTLGLALVKTGAGAGYLIASSPAKVATDPMADSFMVYDRAPGNAFIRSFHVIAGALDNCTRTDGIEAALGNFGAGFTTGVFICQDQHNTGGKPAPQNYKLVPIEQIIDPAGPVATTTTAPVTTPTTAPAVQVPNRSGYWMVGSDGRVYNFGDAKAFGDATLAPGAQAVDLEPSPSGNGYWIVDDFGHVFAKGDAKAYGDVDKALLAPAEVVTSISSTKTGNGYWVFTTLGRVIPFGDATFLGDMTKTKLNGPVLDSIPSASGNGYYMVASDGGIFTFGDAAYKGSMGDKKLNAPVQSLVPDADGSGYWLVASDGGIFAFDAPFKGSMGAIKLNKPVTGMVRFGNGYLMVATDGGIFSFSDKKFQGSLGDNPPAKPITSVAVLDAPAV